MDCTKITYSRRFNLGDYQHEEVSIELCFAPETPCVSPKEAIDYAAQEVLEGSRWYKMELKRKAAEEKQKQLNGDKK